MRKQLTNLLSQMRQDLTMACPSYFLMWDSYVEANFDTYELEPQDNVELITDLIQYLRHSETDRAAMRAPLADDARKLLVATEVQVVAAFEAALPDLRNMSWHLQLKRSVEAIWHRSYQNPTEHTRYAIWDHMAPFYCVVFSFVS